MREVWREIFPNVSKKQYLIALLSSAIIMSLTACTLVWFNKKSEESSRLRSSTHVPHFILKTNETNITA